MPGGGEDIPQAGLVHHRELDPPSPLGQVQPQRQRQRGAWSSSIQQASMSCQQTAAGSAARARRSQSAAGTTRTEPSQRPLERLAGQHLRPSGPGRRDPVAQQGAPARNGPGPRPSRPAAGGPRPAGGASRPGRRQDLRPAQGGAEDGLGLAEPAPAPVQRPQAGQVAVEGRRVAMLDQPVGRGSQVLDLGVESAVVAAAPAGSGSSAA